MIFDRSGGANRLPECPAFSDDSLLCSSTVGPEVPKGAFVRPDNYCYRNGITTPGSIWPRRSSRPVILHATNDLSIRGRHGRHVRGFAVPTPDLLSSPPNLTSLRTTEPAARLAEQSNHYGTATSQYLLGQFNEEGSHAFARLWAIAFVLGVLQRWRHRPRRQRQGRQRICHQGGRGRHGRGQDLQARRHQIHVARGQDVRAARWCRITPRPTCELQKKLAAKNSLDAASDDGSTTTRKTYDKLASLHR